jgi:hypothetical protein
VTFTIPMSAVCCCRCYTTFAVDSLMLDNRRSRGGVICCPLGHRNHFNVPAAPAKVDDARLRELHDQEQQEARDAEAVEKAKRPRGRKPAEKPNA